jgi:hypothetical protein
MNDSGTKWLALCYTLGALPSRNRVYVWRKLKEAGAVYVRQSVAVLPSSDYFYGYLDDLCRRIVIFGGEASMVSLNFLSEDEDARVTKLYNDNIGRDYGRVERMLLTLAAELDEVVQRGSVTHAWLRDRLGSVDRRRRAYNKILLRDYFRMGYSERVELLLKTTAKKIDEIMPKTDSLMLF